MRRFPTSLVYLSIFSLCCLLTIPPFMNGFMDGHDITYHVNWNELFQKQLFSGDLYPRWLFEMNGGRGSPVFYFYSPLPYYISAIFSLLIPGEQSSWYSLGATYCFALTISAIGLFRLLKCYSRPRAAYIVTLLYILFPYHVVVDLYIRFAFAEFFSICLVPYLFLYTLQLANGDSRAVTKIGFAYCLLILSHIPTTILISPFICLYYWIVKRSTEKSIQVCIALTYGVGLAAFYLIPVFFLRKYISIPHLLSGIGYFANGFLLVGNKMFPGLNNYWDLLHYLALVSLILCVLTFFIQSKPAQLGWFFFLSCLICIYMMYPVSFIVWKALPFLHIVQFPWRFFIVLSFFLFYSLALTFDNQFLESCATKEIAKKVLISIFIGISFTTLMSCYRYSTFPADTVYKASVYKALVNRVGPYEYLPQDVRDAQVDDIKLNSLTRIDHLFEAKNVIPSPTHQMHVDKIYLDIKMPNAGILKFNQFYFPTWQCIDKTSGLEQNIRKTASGLMKVELDAGSHNLVFIHKTTVYEIIGNFLSFFTLTVLTYKNRKIFRSIIKNSTTIFF